MTLSREARILLAILAVFGLGFAWLHFSTGFGESAPSAISTPLPNRERGDAANPVNTAALPPEQLDEPLDEPRVARELEIAQLPFLVSAPPLAADPTLADAADPTGFSAESQISTSQASSGQRASVNPFSPLVVAEAEPTPTDPAATERIVDVPAQPEPQVAATPPRRRAPVPSARTPGTSSIGTARLPRALPSGSLASTPELLRSTLDTPTDAQRLANPLVQGETPLAAGSTSLSLYLRDQEVTFTGAVLGPVSVGIFRSADVATPFLVPLGQTLPNTDIVLTDLSGQSAQLSQNDDTQLLMLNLRR